ncbi:hypothetical protein HDV63DRAFT_170472 [Trichoderma sp. SZMC 28014]
MALNTSYNSPSSYGTDSYNGLVFHLTASQLQIIFEWAGLLPLVIYLAASGVSHRLVGQTALAGSIAISLFPRLGVLDNIAAFLREGADFLDRASSVSELRRTVWDANWGSIFPCANGAASNILTKHAIRTARDIKIPDNLAELTEMYERERNLDIDKEESVSFTKINSDSDLENETKTAPRSPIFRRYQTLYILDCTIDSDRKRAKKIGRFDIWLSRLAEALLLSSLLGTCTIALLFGLYGTAAAILISVIFRLARRSIQVVTPPGYLENNEPNQTDGCMLAAIHENASTWYLYRGSRAVVDGLLNKPMILDITARHNKTTTLTLRILAVLQLITMTYVAAQKGWDGVGLLALITVAWTLDYLMYNDDRLASSWLRGECVEIKAWKCQFSGRTAMLGAIQLLKASAVSSWMDQILAPSSRRETWLEKLSSEQLEFSSEKPKESLTEKEINDQKWVRDNWLLTRAAIQAIRVSVGAGAV